MPDIVKDLATKLRDERTPPRRVNSIISIAFFVFAGFASVWLAWLVLQRALEIKWGWLWVLLPFWLILAYVALPRIHRILTSIYLPDYFIGRTRTTDGILGDPVNIAIRGTQTQVEGAMQAGGWVRADEISLRSSWRIIVDTLTRKSYPAAPVSSLLLFNRPQDFAYQKEVDNTPAQRQHVRFWRCPEDWYLPGGFSVDWLAAASFDRKVGLSIFTLQITHKIAPDIDAERNAVVHTLLTSDPHATVDNIEHYASGYHTRNGGGDQIVTDGSLPIVSMNNYQPSPADLTPEENASGAIPGTDVVVPAPNRPITTIFAAVFSVLSALLALTGGTLLYAAVQQIHTRAFPLGLLITVILAVVQILLAFFVWIGVNWARIAQMSITSVSIAVSILMQTSGPDEIRYGLSLVVVTLEILALLALSSQSAQSYSEHRRY